MTTPSYRWRLAGLILAGILTTGCNPLTLPYFLMLGAGNPLPPECKLADKDKNKEVKVVILGYSSLETRPEFLRVDTELSSMLAKRIQEGAKENKEKITVIAPSKVQKYKDEHPNWHALGAEEIGKHFDADYVIDMAIDSITLYEPGSHNQLFRGRAEISLSVIDLHQPGEEPMYRKEYTTEYPKTRGPIPNDGSGTSTQQFRLTFLTHVATDLGWLFTAHEVDDDFHRDD